MGKYRLQMAVEAAAKETLGVRRGCLLRPSPSP